MKCSVLCCVVFVVLCFVVLCCVVLDFFCFVLFIDVLCHVVLSSAVLL